MNSKSEDEDYWHASDSKAFSFDEEEFSYKSTLFDSGKGSTSKPFHDNFGSQGSSITDIIFQGVPTVKKHEAVRRPLGSLVSKHSLSKIFGEEPVSVRKPQTLEEEVRLLRRQLENQWVAVPASKTMKLIMTGQPYSFHLYRSLEQKSQLLDEALKTGDGNAILAVVLFLSSTLKKSLFYQLLQEKPTAVSQYVQYLSTRHLIAELIDLLSMLGQTKEAAIWQFKVAVHGTQNIDVKLRKLNSCYQSHYSASDSKDKQFVSNFISYLEWVTSVNSTGKSVPTNSTLSSLSYLCKNHWTEPKTSNLSPWFLVSQQGISDRQSQWTTLSAMASLQAWDDIEAFFLTKGWIGGKKLKSVLPIEKIIQELHRRGAPSNVLSQYLGVIDDIDTRLEFAKKLSCHSAVIDVSIYDVNIFDNS
ncbi:UNVERIFIED_CONTAM: hypothetical protein PYX00_003755 [Menopon gallinae]|uniref:Vps16 C-terminal domain-containing protein n=1 Tax=Menopon gallinae TaxID=328185 RepID=A0AAW2I168_9NEOP